MLRRFLFIVLICFIASFTKADDASNHSELKSFSSADWPWWRGPHRNGIADADQRPPRTWSATENVRWKAPVPGRGHGSPTVVGDRVFLATADHQANRQAVLCFDRKSGKLIWDTDVHQGGLTTEGNEKASLASATVACDGDRVFINFLNDGAAYTSALDMNGKLLWQTKLTDYVIHQGYGSSPALLGPLVLVSADNKGGGIIAGLSRQDGSIVWQHERPKKPNYPSPILLQADGQQQLIFTGVDLVSSYEPLTGKRLWEFSGATTECVTSTVTDGTLIFTSGGYPKNHVSAVRADGSGKLAWENNVRVYVPSMLVRDGYLYAVADAGVAMCWKCDTGQSVWKQRLGGTFSASPVMVGSLIYATNESGRTYVFEATPDGAKILAENDLGNDVMATPVICGNRIYMRVAEQSDGERQEFLYCLAE